MIESIIKDILQQTHLVILQASHAVNDKAELKKLVKLAKENINDIDDLIKAWKK